MLFGNLGGFLTTFQVLIPLEPLLWPPHSGKLQFGVQERSVLFSSLYARLTTSMNQVQGSRSIPNALKHKEPS